MRFANVAAGTDDYKITEDFVAGNITLKKDTVIRFNIYMAHTNPDQWWYPDKYLPERFDPESKLFLTPSGKQRHPLSFIPFSIGERSCLVYHFAKLMMPSLISKLVDEFDFEL